MMGKTSVFMVREYDSGNFSVAVGRLVFLMLASCSMLNLLFSVCLLLEMFISFDGL